MTTHFDVIVVGARCAGAPTAMLLARKGYRVLVVDRATFPSDTISTHVVHPLGVAALARWGVLDRLIATGCPPITKYTFDFGPITIAGSPGTPESPVAYCPRRTVLDQLLVEAASAAGAEVREAFAVDEITMSDGVVTGIRGRGRDGTTVTETAKIVIGADGRHSHIARAVSPARYHEKPPLLAPYYAYWSGLEMGGRFETYVRERRGWAAAPTHDGLTMVVGGWPYAEFEANKHDLDRHYRELFDLAPAFAERIRDAKRETRVIGTPVEGFFRVPYGPGWALVGDAGYNKDPITAQGILDAFRDAELVTTALDQAFSGTRPYNEAMADYQTTRDRVLPMYELTCQIATLEPPPLEMQQLLGTIYGNQFAMDRFCRMNAGGLSPVEFFGFAQPPPAATPATAATLH